MLWTATNFTKWIDENITPDWPITRNTSVPTISDDALTKRVGTLEAVLKKIYSQYKDAEKHIKLLWKDKNTLDSKIQELQK